MLLLVRCGCVSGVMMVVAHPWLTMNGAVVQLRTVVVVHSLMKVYLVFF